MKKTVLATLIASGIAASTPAMAGNMHDELAALKQRIAQLESQLADTQAAQARSASQASQASAANNWTDKVSVSGSAEFLATASENDDDSSESDLDVDSVELVIGAQVNEYMALSTTLKYEDEGEQGNNDLTVDEAILEIASEDSPWSLTVGRTAVPFAAINGNAWTDPLTDDLTDNTDDLAIVGYNQGVFSAEAYAYRGRHDNDDQNNVENLGLNLALDFDNGVSLGAGYLNDISNAESVYDVAGKGDKVSAARINLAYQMEALALSAEYIKTDSFDELAGKPELSVWHLSADYGTDILGAPGNLSLGYSETGDDADQIVNGSDPLFAEKRITLGVSRELNDNAELIVEAVREAAHNGEDTDTLNVVLSTAF